MSLLEDQTKFLEQFEESLNIKEACAALTIKPNKVGQWRSRDVNGFRAKFLAANERRLDNLEERMFDVIAWSTREENFAQALRYPTLLMFALKAGRPQYRDSVQAATGAADLLSAITKLSDAEDQTPTDNVNRDDRGLPVVPITKPQHDQLEGSIADQLKDIFLRGEDNDHT